MKSFISFLEKKDETKIVKRKKCFKYSNKMYWALYKDNGIVEFWCHDCLSTEKWYLGKWDGEKVIECEGFYHYAFSWDIQKGGIKILDEVKRWIS